VCERKAHKVVQKLCLRSLISELEDTEAYLVLRVLRLQRGFRIISYYRPPAYSYRTVRLSRRIFEL
jgi:hypothetical protein